MIKILTIKIDIDNIIEADGFLGVFGIDDLCGEDNLLDLLNLEGEDYPTPRELIKLFEPFRGQYLIIETILIGNNFNNKYKFEKKEDCK